VNEFGSNVERHRRELLVHCYRMLGSLPDAEDAVQEMLLRAWRYRDSLKEGAPLRPWLYRVATNACLDAIARDERRAVLGAEAEADDNQAGHPDDVVWLGPIPDSVLEPHTPPERTPEALTLMRETIELAFLTVIQLLTPRQRVALILCDVLDWSAKDAADLLDINVSAVNSAGGRSLRVPARRFHLACLGDGCSSNRGRLDHGNRNVFTGHFPTLRASDVDGPGAGDECASLIVILLGSQYLRKISGT
jgi:RNA polymerase sigma-70 factor (ECF subfamily)